MDSLDGFQPERDRAEADRKAEEEQKVKVLNVMIFTVGQSMAKTM